MGTHNKLAYFIKAGYVRIVLMGLLTSHALAGETANTRPVTERKASPNIILILADDLGYGDLGSYGQEKIVTPNIDKLAHNGIRFTNFYAGSTVCAPSRCTLMTGLHTGHCRIRGNLTGASLRQEDVTIAELLQESGYRTGHIGKWGLGNEGSAGMPTKKGFEYFFGYLNHKHAHNYYPEYLIRNEKRVYLKNEVPNEGIYGQGTASKKVEYSNDLFTRDALKYIRDNRNQPFFLYLAYTIPHANNEAGDNGMEVPDYGIYSEEAWIDSNKGYAAMVTRLDSYVGEVMALLKDLNIDNKTIVFFSSDNGPHNKGGYQPHFFNSNGPLRGIKRDLYEGGIRVPLIAHWPGKIKTGTISNHVSYFPDIFPTALDIADIKSTASTDGISLLPTLIGEVGRQEEHPYLYWEFYEQGGKRAVRAGDWKAVQIPFKGNIELYNLQTDPLEQRNVADEHPDIVENLLVQMNEAHSPSPIWKTTQKHTKYLSKNYLLAGTILLAAGILVGGSGIAFIMRRRKNRSI